MPVSHESVTLEPDVSSQSTSNQGRAFAPLAGNAVVALASAAFCLFVASVEHDWYFILPVLAAFVCGSLLFFAASRRPRFSILASLAVFAAIWAASVSLRPSGPRT